MVYATIRQPGDAAGEDTGIEKGNVTGKDTGNEGIPDQYVLRLLEKVGNVWGLSFRIKAHACCPYPLRVPTEALGVQTITPLPFVFRQPQRGAMGAMSFI